MFEGHWILLQQLSLNIRDGHGQLFINEPLIEAKALKNLNS